MRNACELYVARLTTSTCAPRAGALHERVQEDARQLGGEKDRRGLLPRESEHGVTLVTGSVDDRARDEERRTPADVSTID